MDAETIGALAAWDIDGFDVNMELVVTPVMPVAIELAVLEVAVELAVMNGEVVEVAGEGLETEMDESAKVFRKWLLEWIATLAAVVDTSITAGVVLVVTLYGYLLT